MGNSNTLTEIKEKFNNRHLGFIAEYCVPYNSSISLIDAIDILDKDENIIALPVEEGDKVIGILDRETILEIGKSKIALFKDKSIVKYLSGSIKRYDSWEFCERVLSDLLNGSEEVKNLVVYDGRHFQGIVPFNKLLRHVNKIREDQYKLAHRIQQFYFEKSAKKIEGIEFAQYIKMAHHIGGDYIQIQPLSNDIDMVACFDVASKDIAASLTTSILSSFFTMYSWIERDKIDPEDLLLKLNELIIEQTPADIFVTCAFLFIYKKQRAVNIFNFGFSPVYAYSPKEENKQARVYLINPNFIPMGIKPDIDFSKCKNKIAIKPNMKFCFFSDGCTDIINIDGERFGDERLKQFILENIPLPPSKFIDNLEQEINDFSERSVQADDITFVLVKIK